MNRFNSDSGALASRATTNAALERHNLEQWIFSQLSLRAGMAVLDVGCGRGKQMFFLADRITRPSRILGTDISEESVRFVNDTAKTKQAGMIEARHLAHDEIINALSAEAFDLIISTYAIYYASDMAALLERLKSILRPGGTIFVCGFATGTNLEIQDIANRYIADPSRKLKPFANFISDTDCRRLKRTYAQVDQSYLDNVIDFPSAAAVMQWWRNHNTYREEADEGVTMEVARVVEAAGSFPLSKKVMGVRLYD